MQAQSLAEDFHDLLGELTPVPLSAEELKQHQPDLIVNATPVGMWPKVDGTPWPEGLPLPAGAKLYDLVYRPSRTRLMGQALEQGLTAFHGGGMLAAQAALAFARWTGLEPPLAVMRQAIQRFLEKE
jgi:shikimate dehydrogenase